ncbi:hypothetical protein [Brachybacterium vulturis]|uniref:hypothetical protein n=1 Tax=Brachybacterium vulturis TaxID=2017484 RepID=UPI003734CD85
MSARAALDTHTPTTTASTDPAEATASTRAARDTVASRGSSGADTGLRRLEQLSDADALETALTRFLARRRAVRRARRELAVRQARQEHELLMQQALLGTGLSHLR